MKQFYINDIDKVKNFGFIEGPNYVKYISHKAVAMYADYETKRLVFQSPTKDCIAVVCEMYKSGLITIYDDEQENTFTMKVTAEEMNMIFEKRKERLNVKDDVSEEC